MLSNPDVVIRGGTIVDGTGSQPFTGDLAITGDKITFVGEHFPSRGKTEHDAHGLIVTPGWIDCHTHFDAQATWDPYLSPSSANGVTTCIFGNCGIGFAPCQQDRRDFLANLVEAVEDIPGRVIAEGMVWEWETFEEYMDALERRHYASDIAVMIGHCAVRTWVLGNRANMPDRAGPNREAVSEEEVYAIGALVQDAVAAGALGFSTSRGLFHRDPKGNLTPGTLAEHNELLTIAGAIACGGGGILQWTTDFTSYDDISYAEVKEEKARAYRESEIRWMTNIAKQYGDKVSLTFNLGWNNNRRSEDGLQFQTGLLDTVHDAGGVAMGQIFARTQGFLFAFEGRIHPFVLCNTFLKLKEKYGKNVGDFLRTLQEPSNRSTIIKEAKAMFSPAVTKHNKGLRELADLVCSWRLTFPWTPHYEPKPEDSIHALSKRMQQDPIMLAYDSLASGDILWKPLNTYSTRDHSPFFKMYQHPHVVLGGDDAGAHHTMFMDATNPSHMLTHWVRDRSRGPRLPIEQAVMLQTLRPAQLFGLKDRGVLATGMKADVNVIDLQKLKMLKPHFAEDLPLGAGRWLQQVEGYKLTFVSGCTTFCNGTATGILSGRFVRNPKRNPQAWLGISRSVSGPFSGRRSTKEATDKNQHALQGAGSGGASMAARVMRETVEAQEQPAISTPKSRL